METPSLTAAQKVILRGLGQTLAPALQVGEGDLTPEFIQELTRLLAAHELVKLQFHDANRPTRAKLIAKIAKSTPCQLAGAVGHTALFYQPQPDPARQKIRFDTPT